MAIDHRRNGGQARHLTPLGGAVIKARVIFYSVVFIDSNLKGSLDTRGHPINFINCQRCIDYVVKLHEKFTTHLHPLQQKKYVLINQVQVLRRSFYT